MRRLLLFLRLIDADGDLSLTHLAVYLAFFCMARGIQVSWAEMGTFLVAMCSYRVKRALMHRSLSAEHTNRLTALEEAVKKLGSPERLLALRDQLRGRDGK